MVRIPVIPGFNDSLKDGAAFARLFKKMEIKKVQLLPFHRLGSRKYALLGIPDSAAGLRTLWYAIVMTVLYFLSYVIQQRWVFAPQKSK